MVRVLSDGTIESASKDGAFGTFGSASGVRDALELNPGDTAFVATRTRTPEVNSLSAAGRRALTRYLPCRAARRCSVACASSSLNTRKPPVT